MDDLLTAHIDCCIREKTAGQDFALTCDPKGETWTARVGNASAKGHGYEATGATHLAAVAALLTLMRGEPAD